MAILDKEALVALYRRRARNYDITANLYYLMGFREYAYRRYAVEALKLEHGGTVVEIGCGTGLNFPLLQERIGPEGKIIGVDLTDAMITMAKARAESNRWTNVELVRSDAASYRFPEKVGGIISTFAITLVPEFDDVIRRGSDALSPGGRLVILDFKLPATPLAALAPLLVYITKPFGVSLELCERHPWESVSKYLDNSSMKEYYLGFAYLAAGEKGRR